MNPPGVNSIVLIDVLAEIVSDVGAPLLVNVAVLSGTVLRGIEDQLVPVVHSLVVAPVQVPSTARAGVTLAPSANNTARAGARLTSLAIMVAPPLSTQPAV